MKLLTVNYHNFKFYLLVLVIDLLCCHLPEETILTVDTFKELKFNVQICLFELSKFFLIIQKNWTSICELNEKKIMQFFNFLLSFIKKLYSCHFSFSIVIQIVSPNVYRGTYRIVSYLYRLSPNSLQSITPLNFIQIA